MDTKIKCSHEFGLREYANGVICLKCRQVWRDIATYGRTVRTADFNKQKHKPLAYVAYDRARASFEIS